jgi:tetratricopeptide (TPR) repeat protein
MASILPGYEFDIFISYRQKDNRHDHWVSDFVDNLKGEIESTFKQEITIYFDENPHDGILETHDVGATLGEKMKCLIFIPILSRTYCDPKSFAWEHEFKAFVKMASEDQFGLKIRLPNGNVTSRVLPVLIHELDADDINEFESILGGVLRGIEFIYKSPGVNRPLRPDEENPHENLNKIYYRNQINKVANSLRDIVSGLKQTSNKAVSGHPTTIQAREDGPDEKTRFRLSKSHFGIFSGLIVILIVFLGIKFFFHSNKIVHDIDGRISIAVSRFENNSSDSTLNWLEDGIPELLRNNLAANTKELSVQNSQTINEVYETIRHADKASVIAIPEEIARRLRTSTYITGSYQKYGKKILTLAKLVDTNTNEVLWAGKTQGEIERISTLTDSLAIQLRNFLEIKALEKTADPELEKGLTHSSDAYRLYIKGMNSLMKLDFESALDDFSGAVRIDSSFALAAFFVSNTYDIMSVFDEAHTTQNRRLAIEWTKRTWPYRDKLPANYRLWYEMWYAYYVTKNSQDVIKYCNQIEQSDVRSRYLLRDIADTYYMIQSTEDAYRVNEKVEKLSSEWGDDFKFAPYYRNFAITCIELKRYDRSSEIIDKGLRLYPENEQLHYVKICLALAKNDTIAADNMLSEIAKKKNWTPVNVLSFKGFLYRDIKYYEMAIRCFRRSWNMDKKNAIMGSILGYFMILHNENSDEGMKLLKLFEKTNPGEWNNDVMYGTAYSLYRQRKFASADSLLKILSDSSQNAWVELDDLKKKVRDSLRVAE